MCVIYKIHIKRRQFVVHAASMLVGGGDRPSPTGLACCLADPRASSLDFNRGGDRGEAHVILVNRGGEGRVVWVLGFGSLPKIQNLIGYYLKKNIDIVECQ